MFGLRTLCCSLLGPGSTPDVCVPERQEVELWMVTSAPAESSPKAQNQVSTFQKRPPSLIWLLVRIPAVNQQEPSADPQTDVRSGPL